MRSPSEGFKVPEGGGGGVFLPLRSATGVVGVLSVAARVNGRAYDDADARLLASLANLIATFLERQRLQAVATAAEAAREADRLKSSLLSSVSHELKTPLAALTATVSNLLEGDVPWNERSVRDELRAIVSDVARLNNSIGALLDLSRLEARAWEPHRELYELPDILAASLGSVAGPPEGPWSRSPCPTTSRRCASTSSSSRGCSRTCSRMPCCTPARGRCESAPRRTNGGVQIWVEDEGPGISADEHEAVFEKFYRGRRTGTKVRSGTGLGLAITREIVRAHGGSIHVEDVVPRGARFVIDLPAGAVTEEEKR